MSVRSSCLDSSYCLLDGCHNCRNVFAVCDTDSETEWFCTQGALPRPKCGDYDNPEEAWGVERTFSDEDSVEVVARYYEDVHTPQLRKDMAAWEKWSRGREVEPWGKCSHWESQWIDPAKELPPEGKPLILKVSCYGGQIIVCGEKTLAGWKFAEPDAIPASALIMAWRLAK